MRRAIALLIPILASAPAAVRADARDVPIHVARCSVEQQPVMVNPKIGMRMAQVSGITIEYTNAASAAATEIRFRIRYRRTTTSVVDRGSFAPGKKISRQFSTIDAIYSGDSADCSAVSATFTDGTRWSVADSVQALPVGP